MNSKEKLIEFLEHAQSLTEAALVVMHQMVEEGKSDRGIVFDSIVDARKETAKALAVVKLMEVKGG